MDIIRSDARPSRTGPDAWFSGTVFLDEIIQAPAPARIRIQRVSFAPGARTAWHTHPLGQTLHVLAGIGFVQLDGQPARRLGPGDTVWIAPGERHWHGATPDRAFVHLAAQEADAAGQVVAWQEHVGEDDYRRAAGEALRA